MSYQKRVFSLILVDSIIVLTSIFISNYILSPFTNSGRTTVVTISAISLLLSHHFFAYRYRLYKRVWSYASIGELVAIFKSISLSILVTAVVQLVFTQHIFRALIITWMMHVLFIGGARFSWRMYRDTYMSKDQTKAKKRTLIIGAGSAGTLVARQLKSNTQAELAPAAFIDDDPMKHRLEIMGLPVLGGREKIEQVVKDLKIENIAIAIPSLNKKELNKIVEECNKTTAKTQIVPMLQDLLMGKVSINEFRDVQIEDLLGRDPVELDTAAISRYIRNSVILVTGAGGSIGSEICRQISKFSPSKVILLGHGENSIYSIEMELRGNNEYLTEYITEIADVQDRDKVFKIIEKHRPKVVFHAAAHKHVPLMERNPEAAVKNNVIGTKNVAEAADNYGVETFVMISTDKAVNPTNVMGASKRMAEMIIQNLNRTSKTRFVAVRFGNVLGSRGSVIPLFKEQIRKGGPVTVTHPDMVRYFMTIPEASRLVLQASVLARGGEIFVLDMGEPVKIVDLAKNLIRLSGCDEQEIGIEFTGMRPGEKLFEEMLNENEVHGKQVFPKIYIGKTANLYIDEIHEIIHTFINQDKEVLRSRLLALANNQVEPKKVVYIAN